MDDRDRRTALRSLPFDETADQIEAIYRTSDVAAQRRAVLRVLAPRPDEQILDVGCGPGFLTAELAAAVGPTGRVVGVDRSAAMLSLAQTRVDREGFAERVEIHAGDATRLPVAAAAFDAAVSSLTLEFSGNAGAAIAELFRVLRPGGRAAILDTDWDSVVWHSSDRTRMELVLAAWVGHVPDPYLPRTLAPRLRRAGFALRNQEVVPLFNPTWSADTYSFRLIGLIRHLVVGLRGLTASEVEDWADDLRRLGDSGASFFSLNRYLFLAAKPAA